MPKAQPGNTVKVNYTGRLENGTVFDQSTDEPLTITLGAGRVIPGFEEALIGMEPGATKSAVVPPDKGYGPHREELVGAIERANVPNEIELVVGNTLRVGRSNGEQERVTVVDLTDSTVTLDANHPLAGKNLIFELQLVEVV